MDLTIEGALWLGMISGGFALLGLAAEGVERFCDWFDDWQRSVFTRYVDDE